MTFEKTLLSIIEYGAICEALKDINSLIDDGQLIAYNQYLDRRILIERNMIRFFMINKFDEKVVLKHRLNTSHDYSMFNIWFGVKTNIMGFSFRYNMKNKTLHTTLSGEFLKNNQISNLSVCGKYV